MKTCESCVDDEEAVQQKRGAEVDAGGGRGTSRVSCSKLGLTSGSKGRWSVGGLLMMMKMCDSFS